DTPSVGVAKSVLVGTYGEPGPAKGDWSPLMDKDEVIGAALRTRASARPIFVSIGHRVCLATAISLVLGCTISFRLPQTTRAADRLSKLRGPASG
ncbi:MAG TPA: endonuclease V, partial [Rhodospirillales bacterium]|nr:endonuclease V [Rhodospirillales bacterium]